MDESEQGLLAARHSRSEQKARIAAQILADDKLHLVWESRHAELLLPVSEHRKSIQQIVDLRLVSVRLIHGQALIEYIRDNKIRGDDRERFFAQYYGVMEYQNAVLAAHRDYMLATSSLVSASHLIDLMFDPVSHELLTRYRDAYRKYFALASYAAGTDDTTCAQALRPFIKRQNVQLKCIRNELGTVAPDKRCCEIEKQACLARSGRYPVINYLLV